DDDETRVDLEALRRVSRHGVPQALRGRVWRYLLGVQEADRSSEVSTGHGRSAAYEALDKRNTDVQRRVHRDMQRYLRSLGELRAHRHLSLHRRHASPDTSDVSATGGTDDARTASDFALRREHTDTVANVVCTYLNQHAGVAYSDALVSLCAPFV